MLIRPAEAGDLPALQALHLANWRRDYAGHLPDAYLGAPVAAFMAERWRALPEADDICHVAVQGTAVLGLARLRADHPAGPLLESLHVDATARGTGAGRALLASVAQRLRDAGHRRMWLEVLQGNGAARGFYQAMGGTEGWPFKDDVAGNPVVAVPVFWEDLPALIARAG